MAERIPQDYSQALSQALEEYQQAVAAREGLRVRELQSRQEIQQHWLQLQEARQRALEATLADKKLAVCSNTNPHRGTTEEERLGVFPKSQMRMLYGSVHTANIWEVSLSEGINTYYEGTVQLRQLCPEHFPSNPNRVSKTAYGNKISIISEVVKRNGRLVTTVNAVGVPIDVTDVPIDLTYSEQVYRHFGLPPLPEHPRS